MQSRCCFGLYQAESILLYILSLITFALSMCTRKRGPKCSVLGCTVIGGHLFPSESKHPVRRKLWEVATCRENFKAGKRSVICKLHFKPEDFVVENKEGVKLTNKILCKDAVPTVYNEIKDRMKIQGSTMQDFLQANRHRKWAKEEELFTHESFAEFEFCDVSKISTDDIYDDIDVGGDVLHCSYGKTTLGMNLSVT